MQNCNFTRAQAMSFHLWNYLREPEERRDYYMLLRMAGATSYQAMRWRDWSKPKIEALLVAIPTMIKRKKSDAIQEGVPC